MEAKEIIETEEIAKEISLEVQIPEKKPEPGKKNDRNARFKLFLANSFLGMVLYVLSFGPMYWHWYRSMYLGGDDFFVRLYGPLLWLAEIDFFGKWLQKYVEWWIF